MDRNGKSVRDGGNLDDLSSNDDDYSGSSDDYSDSNDEYFDSDTDVSFSADDDITDSEEEGAEGFFVTYTVDHERDPNIGSTYGSYKIDARNQASCLFRVIDQNIPGFERTASIIDNKEIPSFMAKYQKVKDLSVNKIHEVVQGKEKSLVVYQKTYRNLHEYVCTKIYLPETEVAKLFQQICKILADLHEVGIVVRDLKARKFVFVDPESKKLVLETWEDTVLLDNPENDKLISKSGCPTYASPELIINREIKYSGKMADCWSLGVILFALLTNRYPFFDFSIDEMFTKIRQGRFKRPEHRSVLVRSLLRALLNVDPKTRLTAAEALKHEWFRIFCNSDDKIPHHGFSFGQFSLPGIPESNRESPNYRSGFNTPQNSLDLPSPSTSGCTSQITDTQQVIEPQDPDLVPYPVFSEDQCVPQSSQGNIETSTSFAAQQSSTPTPRE